MSKFMYEMTSEEAKKVIEDFYSEATPEELLKIVVEAGLLEKGYREMIDWRRVLKTDDIFKKHPMDMTPDEGGVIFLTIIYLLGG